MEQSAEDSTSTISIETVVNDVEALVKSKEEGNSVDHAQYQQALQKIEIIKNDRAYISLLQNLPEEVVIKILQLHDRAEKLTWNKLTAKLRTLALIAGEGQSHDIIEQIVELLLKYKAVNEEINFEILVNASKFDVVKWIKKGGNLLRLANYLQQFKFTRTAFEILHLVMTKPELTDIIESELSVPILDVYLRLTKHKGATLALEVWRTFNQPKYFELIKQLSPEMKLDWIIFIVQHYSDDFEEKYFDLFKSLVLSVDVSLLPRAFRPGQLLSEHFFIKIMRDNKKKTFDLLMQIGYNFATFKKPGRALKAAIQLENSYFVKEILKRKLLNLSEVDISYERSHLVYMKDLSIYQMMHASGYNFSKEPLLPDSDIKVDFPFMNALMDWYRATHPTQVVSLKRLSIIAIKTNNLNEEKLPHDLRDAIDEYKEPWYWLNWNDDEANKQYWKELARQLLATAKCTDYVVDFTLRTIYEENMMLRVTYMNGSYYNIYSKPQIILPLGYRNLPKDCQANGSYNPNNVDTTFAEYLGVTVGDLPIIYGLLVLVASKLTAKARGAEMVWDPPFWQVYNPTTVWNSNKLSLWYSAIMSIIVGVKYT